MRRPQPNAPAIELRGGLTDAVTPHAGSALNHRATDGPALLAWQRGKAGTIEHVNDVLENERAAGVSPSATFGANAAWLRLQVPTHTLLALLEATALAPQDRRARPKRLRFAVFTQFGRVVRQAREQFVRLTTRARAPAAGACRG